MVSIIKNIFIKFSLFWKIYFFLLFLCSLGGIFIPWDNDHIWIWIFYVPFSFFLVYLYSFIMGIYIQRKLSGTIEEILLLSIIYFILVLILLTISLSDKILINGIIYIIKLKFYPALGSTLLFIVGAFIAKFKQRN